MKRDKPPPNFPREEPLDFEKIRKQLAEDGKQYISFTSRAWTTEEDQILIENYQKLPDKAIANRLGRSEKSVYCHIHDLGLVDKTLTRRFFRKRDSAQ